MSKRNTFRNDELSEDIQEEMSDAVEEKVEETQNFLRTIFSPAKLSTYLVTRNLPFVAFLLFLALVYISNRHLAERTVRQIDSLGREVKHLSCDSKAVSGQLMEHTTQTEIAKTADILALEERRQQHIKVEVVRKEK